ncbi:hypothetical protein SDC9_128484 [bioreactor metagenome]|uniref:Uncharacterized protein n=1 Tax=bioreactor metagenome TaxID=1076179 RepID=A0A645CWZ9_9ZZZZ
MPRLLLQLYVLPPLTLMVVFSPAQMVGSVTDAETVGNELTVTVTFAVLEHPDALVPVTAYVVVAVGLTVKEDPEPSP